MEKRTGVITFAGKPLTLLGPTVSVGQKAPNFLLKSNDLSSRSLSDYEGKTLILSIVPSLDTGVCDMQTRRFNQEAAALGRDVRILTISCDLPFAQARWCGAAGATQLETLSDYYDMSFGNSYGLTIEELHLLARAVLVIRKDGTISYIEIVPEVTNEVNFEAALEAAKKDI